MPVSPYTKLIVNMDLLEYQAKELFREMGIPVLPSQRIDHPSDLKGLRIPYPIALKSQVRVGGRGKAGGVKFVENTIDAVAAAQAIFHLPIMGEYPQVVLAESKYDADQEFYLAVILDRAARRPVLLGSIKGGIDAEATLEYIQLVGVDEEFSPFYARRLALKMGLKGELIESVSGIVQKMYQLFVQKDLDLVEINPLGVSATGQVMALDGKVSANDEALGRHPELATLASKMSKRAKEEEIPPALANQNFVQLDGNIAIICNGAGLTMATLDLVCFLGGQPANFLNISPLSKEAGWGVASYDSIPGNPLPKEVEGWSEYLEQALELATQNKNVKVVLVNILGSVTLCEETAVAIETYLKRRESSSRTRGALHFIVRLVGGNLSVAKERLSAIKVPLVEDLEEAVAKAVAKAVVGY